MTQELDVACPNKDCYRVFTAVIEGDSEEPDGSVVEIDIPESLGKVLNMHNFRGTVFIACENGMGCVKDNKVEIVNVA